MAKISFDDLVPKQGKVGLSFDDLIPGEPVAPVSYDPMGTPIPVEEPVAVDPALVAKIRAEREAATPALAPQIPTEQLPLAVEQPQLAGKPANVPLPPRRVTTPEVGEVPVQPLEEAPIRTGGRYLDRVIGGQTGILTPEESVKATQEKVAGAEAAAEQAAIDREETKARQAETLKSFVDKDGVPFVDKIADLEAQKAAAENRPIAKQLQIQINNVMASAPFEFRQLLAQQKLGVSEEQESKARAEQAQQAAVQAKLAPPVTQTFARSALETTGQTIGSQTADTIVALQRVATSPVSLIEAVTGNKEIMSKEIDREAKELHKNLSGGFAPDVAQANDLGMKVVQGVASTAAFAGTGGVATKAFALPKTVMVAIAGGLPQAEQQWQEALSRQQEDPSLEGWRKWLSFTAGLGIGATEALPISNLFNRLEKITNGGLTRYLAVVAANSGEEGVQEALQQLLQNANSIAILKDPNATLTKDVAENALVGALSGAVFSGGLAGASAGANQMRSLYKTPEEAPAVLRPFLFPEYKKPEAGKATPPAEAPPAAPPTAEVAPVTTVPDREQYEILKGAGFAVDDIADMTDAQRQTLVQEEVEKGTAPVALTEEEAATIAPPAPPAPPSPEAGVEAPGPEAAPAPEAPSAKKRPTGYNELRAAGYTHNQIMKMGSKVITNPDAPLPSPEGEPDPSWLEYRGPEVEAPEAPSARAQQLVEQGVAPLEAMQQAAAPKTEEVLPPVGTSNLQSEKIGGILGGLIRGEHDIKTRKTADGHDLYFNGEKIGSVQGSVTQDKVSKELLQKLLDSYKDEGRVMPRDPRDMTLNEFTIAQGLNRIIPQFEVDLPDFEKTVKVNPDGTFSIDYVGLYKKIREGREISPPSPIEAAPEPAAKGEVARIVSRRKGSKWIISGLDANGKQVFQLDPIQQSDVARDTVYRLVGENPKASLGVHKKITPDGMASIRVQGKPQGFSTLRGFIDRIGGIAEEGGELASRNIPKNLIREGGVSHEEATRRAIDAGFFPDYVPPALKAGEESYQAPPEMIDRFRDALGQRKFDLPKSAEAAEEAKKRKEADIERDRLGPWIKDIKADLKARNRKMSDDDIRDAAIMLENGEADNVSDAIKIVHFQNDIELIGNDMADLDREVFSQILGDEMWDNMQSLADMRQEGELLLEPVEPLEMEGELEAQPSPDEAAIPTPREGGAAREKPAEEKAPEAVGAGVEAGRAGKPEEKVKEPSATKSDVDRIQKMLDERLRPGYKVSQSARPADVGRGVLIADPVNKKPVFHLFEDIPAWIDSVIRLVPSEAKAPAVEKGAEGKPQLVIPGAEKIGEKEQLERQAAKPMRGAAEQKEPGGMFGPTVGQKDLMDLVKEQPPMPKAVVEGKKPTQEEKAQRDEENIQSDIPPEGIDPPVPDISLADAQAILRGKKIEVKKVGDNFIVSGKTYPYKDLMKKNLGRYDGSEKTWSFKYDPTQNIAAAIKEVDSVTSAARAGGEGAGTVSERDESKRISELRAREDARPDERIADPAAKVSAETKQLISNGLKFGIPQEVVTDQIEDVGMAVNAFEKNKPMFLLANEAGTGKTFVLGGIIRELRNKGVKKFAYVTQNQDLITQIKKDLAPYGVDDVQFVTYSKMEADVKDGILIFDEAHNVKNIGEGKGRAVEGQKMMQQAKMTIFASATPFQNPSETEYLSGTGLFDNVGGFADWAKAYGSSSRKFKFFNPKTQKEQTVTKIYWVNTAENKKNGAAARQWFMKQGIMTQRAMKIDPKMVDVTFKREKVDEKWVDLYNRVMKAYDTALNRFATEGNGSTDNKITGEIMRHRESMIKRILEASKINAAIDRAKELLKEGKYVVIFVETKADRNIGRFRRSEHFKDDKLYTFPEMETMMMEWNQEAGMARMNNEKAPPRPFAAFIYEIASAMHEAGLDTELPSTSDDILAGLGGQDKVAVYTGAVAGTTATKNKNDFMAGRKKVLIATMAKGGTGLSLHDTVGNRPTVQLNINLPWAAWQVDQVSARVARYGLKSKAMIEWMFASNIPWESERLVPRVGARMADMGAIVKGIEIKAAEKLLGDFNFEGEMDVKQAQGEGKIQYSAFNSSIEPLIPDVINHIHSVISRMVGDRVAVKFYDTIIMDNADAAARSGGVEGNAAGGFYDNANGIIGLALDMESGAYPFDAMYHEVFHVLEDLLTPAEINALNRNADYIKNLVLSTYDQITPESYDRLDIREQRAYAMGAYGFLRDRKAAIPAGPARTILNKLYNIWKAITRAIRDVLGRRTAEDVFSDVYLGNLKYRMNDTIKDMNKVAGKAYAAVSGPSLPGLGPQAAPRKPVQQKLPGLPTPKAAAIDIQINRSNMGSKFAYNMLDRFIDIADYQKAIETARGAPLTDSADVYLALQLYQDRVIARQDKTWSEEVEPMIAALEKADVTVDDLGLYAYAKHAFERNEEMQRRDPARFVEGGSGLTDQEAQDILDNFANEGKLAALEQIAKDHLYPMIRKDVAARFANGLLTQDQYNQYTRPRSQGGYDFYVPLTGYAEDEAEATGKPQWTSGVGKGFPVYGKEYKVAFGRESLALNPVFSTVNRRMEGITRTEKQRVDLRLYNLVKNNPNPDFAEIVKPGDDYVKKLAPDGTVQYVSSTVDRTNPFIFTLKIGGKEVYIRFNSQNENMARFVSEMKGLGGEAGTLMKATMAIGRYFSKINTQWVPDFFLVNFPRDLQDALLNLYGTKEGLSKAMLANVAKSAKVIAKYNTGGELTQQDKALLEEWKMSGGHLDYGGFRTAEKNAENFEKRLKKDFGKTSLSQKGLEMSKNGVMNVLGAIETINDTFDSTVRFAVYLAARENGLNKERSALLSRRATVDFKSGGKYKPMINALYPFAGAALAGSRGLYRLAKSPRGRKAMLSIMLISAMNSLLGSYMSDDDEYDPNKAEFWTQIKANERTNSIILPIKVNGRYVKIPLGFYLQPFWVAGDQIMGASLGQVGPMDAAVNIATAFSNAFNPLGSGSLIHNLVPVQLRGIYETWMNEDWLGRQMHPERKNIAKSAQYYDKTSDISITLADQVNRLFGGNPYKPSIADIYPSNIDYWAGYITGGVGRFVTGSANAIYKWAEGEETPLEKLPVVRRFVTSTENIENTAYSTLRRQVDEDRSKQSKAISDSQDKTIPLEQRREAKELAIELRKDLGTKITKGRVESPLSSLPGIFKDTDKKIDAIEEKIGKIQVRKDISVQEKKALSKPLEDRIIELKNMARKKVMQKQQRQEPTVSPLRQLKLMLQ